MQDSLITSMTTHIIGIRIKPLTLNSCHHVLHAHCFRFFSIKDKIIGGLVFGSIGGIFLGAIGLSLSAVFLYLIGQSLGKNWFKNKFKKTHLILEKKINLYGLLPVFLITAHPLGPQTPINFAAGVMNLPIMKYVLIILIATPIRATFYSLLGATILSLSITKILMVTFGLILLGLLPIYISNLNDAGLDLINKK